MAQLGKIEGTVLNAEGQPAEGVTIEIRSQGAQVRGGSGATPYTVDDVGAVATGSTVVLYSTSSKTETSGASATINSGSSIGTAPDLGSAADDDRLSVTSPLPTIYEDVAGATSTSNPFTTDSEGHFEAYVEGGYYDIKRSGGGVTTRLYTDIVAIGGRTTSYIFDSATAVGFRSNIVSAATGSTVTTAGAVIHEFSNAGTRKAAIDKDGDFIGTDLHVTSIDTVGGAAIGAGVTVGTTLAVTGASTLAAVTASGLITGSAGLTISGGTVSLPAGEIGTAELASAAVTNIASAIQGAAMNGTGAAQTITGCTISPTISSVNSTVLLLGYSDFVATSGATNYTVTHEIYNGATPLATSVNTVNSASIPNQSTFLMHVQTGISGAQTYTLAMNANANVTATAGRSRIVCIEIKK